MNEIDYLVVPTERSVEVKTSSILKQSVQRLRNTEINANWRTKLRLNTTQIYSEGRTNPFLPCLDRKRRASPTSAYGNAAAK
jgi:hypothetical protein